MELGGHGRGGGIRLQLHHILVCPSCANLRWLNLVEAKDDGTESLYLQCTECNQSEVVETAFGLGRE